MPAAELILTQFFSMRQAYRGEPEHTFFLVKLARIFGKMIGKNWTFWKSDVVFVQCSKFENSFRYCSKNIHRVVRRTCDC